MKPAVKTEFYIKAGLVILGARVLFGVIMKAGFLGMIQALAVVTVVWYCCWWLCKKLGIDDDFAAMLSSAVSICGVSAAIATAGAVKGDPKKLSYVTSIVLMCAVPMMVLMPIISKAVGMPDAVASLVPATRRLPPARLMLPLPVTAPLVNRSSPPVPLLAMLAFRAIVPPAFSVSEALPSGRA